jgi:hypothetical protein
MELSTEAVRDRLAVLTVWKPLRTLLIAGPCFALALLSFPAGAQVRLFAAAAALGALAGVVWRMRENDRAKERLRASANDRSSLLTSYQQAIRRSTANANMEAASAFFAAPLVAWSCFASGATSMAVAARAVLAFALLAMFVSSLVRYRRLRGESLAVGQLEQP